jgi:Ca2+-binding RTX toxin-like protein
MDRMQPHETGTISRRPGRKTLAGVGLSAMLLAGAAGSALAATLTGDSSPNDIVGTAGADVISGLGGDDDLYGRAGNDIIRGGAGDDDIYGEEGNDRLFGGPGDDDIYGGPGNDRIFGGPGEDDIYGGPGNDRIRAVDRHHDDIECGPGFDRVWANPGDDVAADCEVVVRRGVTVSEGGSPAPAGGTTITAQRAGEIAAAHVNGRVDQIEPERDYGAAWEVEVYAPDGEYVIYVSATGEIVRVVGPSRW